MLAEARTSEKLTSQQDNTGTIKMKSFKKVKAGLVLVFAATMIMVSSCTKDINGGGNSSGSGTQSNGLNGTSWTDGYGTTASFQASTVWISQNYGAKKNKYSYQYNAPNISFTPISGDGMLVNLTGTVSNDIMYIHNPTITYGSTLIATLYKE